jgi:hypothetical protein
MQNIRQTSNKQYSLGELLSMSADELRQQTTDPALLRALEDYRGVLDQVRRSGAPIPATTPTAITKYLRLDHDPNGPQGGNGAAMTMPGVTGPSLVSQSMAANDLAIPTFMRRDPGAPAWQALDDPPPLEKRERHGRALDDDQIDDADLVNDVDDDRVVGADGDDNVDVDADGDDGVDVLAGGDIAPPIGPDVPVPLHDKEMAQLQLSILDPNTDKFTFQFFSDDKNLSKAEADAKAKTVHGTLDEVWPRVLAVNTPQVQLGAYITVNETDGSGRRKKENITRVRGHFVDADNPEAVEQCQKQVMTMPASMTVDTGRGSHYYWLRNDLPLADGTPDPLPLAKFTALQDQLNAKLGTDKQVKDLPRVLRLAGTLHLKDPNNPRLIRLRNKSDEPVIRYSPVDLLAKLELTMPADPEPKKPATAKEHHPHMTMLKVHAGAEFLKGYLKDHPDILKDYDDWMNKLARPFAHQAMLHEDQKEELWQMLDEMSKLAPGYDEANNADRFDHFIAEAEDKPADGVQGKSAITIGTFFWWLTEKLGWNDIDPVIGEMNRRYSAGIISDKFRIARFGPHPQYPLQWEIQFLSKDDFLNSAINPRVQVRKLNKEGKPDGMKGVPRGHYWFGSSDRNEYDAVTFIPNAPAIIRVNYDGRTHKTLNTYAGFACEPDFDDSEAKCALFLAHMRDNAARDDDGLYEYILDWMASGIQQPENPGRTAISMRGVPGAGKGTIALFYGRLLGQHFLHATKRDHVTGRFNKHQGGKCLIFVDETLYAEIATDTQVLKALTTEDTKLLEPKGIDAFPVPNYARLIFATNAAHPIVIEYNDRRYVAIEVLEPACVAAVVDQLLKAKKRRAYFAAIREQMRNGGSAALLGFLLKRDISNFEAEAIPETAERLRQKLLSAPAEDQVLIGFAHDGRLPGALYSRPWIARANQDLNKTLPQPPALFDAMRERGGQKLSRLSDHKLADILKTWDFKPKSLGDSRGWEAPALSELRKAILAKYPAVKFEDDAPTKWVCAENRENELELEQITAEVAGEEKQS